MSSARRRLLATLLPAAVLSLVASCTATKPDAVQSQPTAPQSTLTDAQRQTQLDSFDHVWTTIRDNHFDPTFNGVDWDAVRTEFRPRVEAANNADEARAAMTGMIDRLKQSHFSIIPASSYQAVDVSAAAPIQPASTSTSTNPSSTPSPERDAFAGSNQSEQDAEKQQGVTGLHVWPVGTQALVLRVDPGSPADLIGVRPGWIVSRVGTHDIDAMLKVGRESLDGKLTADLYLSMTIAHYLSGRPGEVRTVTFLDAADRPAIRSIGLTKSKAIPAKFGNLPTIWLTHEYRRLDSPPPNHNRVGYFAFSTFFEPALIAAEMQKAVEDARDLDGLIIDLRGNIGGIGAMAMGIGGWFVDQPRQNLGTMTTRQSKLTFVLNPRAKPYTKPLAILIDGGSASTSEVLAGGLKDLGRARLFGSTTAGAALPSRIEKLANGDGFQYAFADYVSTGGQRLEGLGVQPDQIVIPDRASLLAGRDPVIDAATAWISSQRPPPTQ